MKKLIVIISLVLIGILLTAAVPLNSIGLSVEKSSTTPKETIKKEFEVKPGGKVIIDLETGSSIEIKGWDKDLVSAEATYKNKDEIEFRFEKNGNTVEITSDYTNDDDHHSNAKLVLQIPKKFDVEFSTMGGGVTISYVEGKMEGKTMGGELDLRNLKGYLDVTTMGGAITLKDSEVDGRAKTMGGEVLVENVKGDINASSMGGKVRHINVSGKEKSVGNEVDISTMGGDLDIDRAPNGAKLKTMGGEITINYAGKFLDAETMGGDIKAKEVDGWIKAKTMGGEVDIKMVGNPKEGDRNVKLTSMGGDITLVVPDGLSMDIDIEIAYMKNSHKDFEDCKIVSDFKIDEERTTEWERKHGSSARKYIYGKGSVDGGKNKIIIKTINSSVYLKKGWEANLSMHRKPDTIKMESGFLLIKNQTNQHLIRLKSYFVENI